MKQLNIAVIDIHGQSSHGKTLGDILGSITDVDVQVQTEFYDGEISVQDASDHIKNIAIPDTHCIFLILVSVNTEKTKAILQRVRNECSDVPIIAIPEGCKPHDVVSIIRGGATDFIIPPLKDIDIIPRIWRLIEQTRQKKSLAHKLKEKMGLNQLVGKDPAFAGEMGKIPAVAACDSTVLITGETGTGKELCARAIHYLSPRNNMPFVPVNCGAIPADLMENELFGHVRGAYTGATTSQAGLLSSANRGTLFLDEIDCLPLSSQVKLLRLLQDKVYRQLGSTQTHHADVRIIAATNLDLEAAVRKGTFRRDLFYRLNIIPFTLPPLRDRTGDIPDLARHFLALYSRELNKEIKDLTSEALQKLLIYDWPGNVRELENVIERAVVFSTGPVIAGPAIALPLQEGPEVAESFQSAKSRVIAQFEKNYLTSFLLAHQGNITQAAKAAKKNRRAFWELMRKHNIGVQNKTTG
jgi:DNA-binding NtrC family response regulator